MRFAPASGQSRLLSPSLAPSPSALDSCSSLTLWGVLFFVSLEPSPASDGFVCMPLPLSSLCLHVTLISRGYAIGKVEQPAAPPFSPLFLTFNHQHLSKAPLRPHYVFLGLSTVSVNEDEGECERVRVGELADSC